MSMVRGWPTRPRHFGLPFAAFTTDVGVDIVSFGGAKNGLMYGEAIVVLNPSAVRGMPFLRKAAMQLSSKMRFIGVQFECLLGGDLWLRSAQHANAMAARLAAAVADVPGLRISRDVQANAVFAVLPADVTARLQKQLPVLRMGRAHLRGAVDVRVRHHRGRRRRVRGRDPRRADRPRRLCAWRSRR